MLRGFLALVSSQWRNISVVIEVRKYNVLYLLHGSTAAAPVDTTLQCSSLKPWGRIVVGCCN